jgi:hypothetical protein
MGASLPTRIKVCFSVIETSQCKLNQKVWVYAISWEGYTYRVLGFSWSTVSPFSDAWWKCKFCNILWSSVEASGCNSQKSSRQIGKRSTASSWKWQTPYSPRNPGKLQWKLFEHMSYSPDFASTDFHLLGPLNTTLVANVSLMTKMLKRGEGSGWDNSQKTSMLRVSTHWLRDETGVSVLVEDMSRKFFPCSNITCFTFYIQLWLI